MEADREAAVLLLLDELVGAAVPDLDRAGAVLPRRDLALEVAVVERVILDVHRQVPLAERERHALRHRPAQEHPVPLEAEVVVEAARGVALDDEAERVARLRLPPNGSGVRFGSRFWRYVSSGILHLAHRPHRTGEVSAPALNIFVTLGIFPCKMPLYARGISLWKVWRVSRRGYSSSAERSFCAR